MMNENKEQKYELLVDNLLDIIVELDLNGNFIFISPQSIDITGYHHNEIIGTSIYQCIHPNDITIIKNAIEEAKIKRNHISLEFRVKHKNGNYVDLSAKGRLVDIDGKQKIIVLASEFSKDKGKLKESENILNKIIDQTFMGFVILQDFEVKFLNPKFSEVIGNLLTNAIKYSPPSNSIAIKSEIKDGFYVISVKDNGIGFTSGEKLKLFNQFGKIDRFDQDTKLAAEGSGLGLYITKKLVELHGGKIWVESEGRNKGSTFYFTLPIIKE